MVELRAAGDPNGARPIDGPRPPGRAARWAPRVLIAYWLALFVATHWPRLPHAATISGLDKLAHMGAYAVLALLVGLALRVRRPLSLRDCVGIVVGLAVYGLVDEVLQIPVGREGELLDWAADVAGIVIGLGVFLLVDAACARRRSAGGSRRRLKGGQ